MRASVVTTNAVPWLSFSDTCESAFCSNLASSSIQAKKSETVNFSFTAITTAVTMPNTQIVNDSNSDHILRGQANWVPWFLRFRLDAHAEGIWSLFDGSEKALSKPERPIRLARAGTDLTATTSASNAASSALATATRETIETSDIDFSHQIFLYQTELEFFRMDLHDYERQEDRIVCGRKMLYARIDSSMFAMIRDDNDHSLSSEFVRLQSYYKPEASLAIQLTRRKIDQISLVTCKDMSEFLNKMRQLRQELAYAGEPMSDARYTAMLFDGLPARYNAWKDRYYETANGLGAPNISLVYFEERLIHWEYTLKQSAGRRRS
jgi:hypothetical protein